MKNYCTAIAYLGYIFRKVSMFILIAIFISSCDDFLAIDPPKTQIVTATVFTDDVTARSAMFGVYSTMMSSIGFAGGGNESVTHLCGLSADEFNNYSAGTEAFAKNSLLPENGSVKLSLWDNAYQLIYYSNSVMHGLSLSTKVSDAAKKQLEGEARFVRAFCHFYLTNLFGDVPIATTVDYRVNTSTYRSQQADVYKQIISDLQVAQEFLSEEYPPISSAAAERVRPNKSTATSLLARCYLFLGDWLNAEGQSSAVISNTMYSLPPNLNAVFLKNSSETIWQLKPVIPGNNTNEAGILLPTTPTSPPGYVSLTSDVVNSFEAGDKRRSDWIVAYVVGSVSYYYPFKYKQKPGPTVTEYSTVLRLAEQYLIRAEARAHQGKLADAIQDLDVIRGRAGLPLVQLTNPLITKSELLKAIAQERRVELFSEWGHRWLDLKRTETANDVLGSVKGAVWNSTDVLYPIPSVERNNNPRLTQNPGY